MLDNTSRPFAQTYQRPSSSNAPLGTRDQVAASRLAQFDPRHHVLATFLPISCPRYYKIYYKLRPSRTYSRLLKDTAVRLEYFLLTLTLLKECPDRKSQRRLQRVMLLKPRPFRPTRRLRMAPVWEIIARLTDQSVLKLPPERW